MWFIKKKLEEAYLKGFGEGFRKGLYMGTELAERRMVITGSPQSQVEKDIEEILKKKGVN